MGPELASTRPAQSGSTIAGETADDVAAVDLDLALLAVRIMDTTKQDVREVADEEGLSTAQLDVLRRLRHHGPTPMRRLAEQMNCEASNLTGLVDRLESRGLVERRPDPTDRRVRLLALTGEGSQLSQSSWVAVARRCPLTTLAPEQRVQLAQLLREALRRDAHPETAHPETAHPETAHPETAHPETDAETV